MAWMNNDGLFVRFNGDKATNYRGGEINTDNLHAIVFDLPYTEVQSATASVVNGAEGEGRGVLVSNDGLVVKVEVLVLEAFTSSGTVGSGTLVLGVQKEDRATELDYDGFLTSSFVGTNLDKQGELTEVKVGSTGAGALVGTVMSENGLVTVSNSTHATNPYTAGKARITIWYLYPENSTPDE